MGHYDSCYEAHDDKEKARVAKYRSELLKELSNDPVLVSSLFELVRSLGKWSLPADLAESQLKNYEEVRYKIR